jgi:predicted nuclease of predicted toxin-antitoxin system
LPDPVVDPRVRFLADESCDFAVVRALRAAGFDVAAVSEDAAGSPDEKVIELARAEQRILLTEDRDFGRLVFAAGHTTIGVVFIRFPGNQRADLPARMLDVLTAHSARLSGAFLVVTPDQVRVTRLPR